MSSISEMLSTSTEQLVRKYLPAGDYLCQIVEADILHGYWKPKPPDRPRARYFDSFVPTIEIIDFVRSGDQELDDQLEQSLNAFDENWKGFRPPTGNGKWVMGQEIPGYDKRVLCAGIANGLNFALAEASEGWASFEGFASQATAFYTSENSHGEQDGFVVKKLSTDPETFTPPPIQKGAPLSEIIEATKGTFLIVSLGIEEDPSGKYEPKVVVTGTEQV